MAYKNKILINKKVNLSEGGNQGSGGEEGKGEVRVKRRAPGTVPRAPAGE